MSTSHSGPCKRRYPRFETSLPGTLHGMDGSESVACKVIDISLVGARLLTDERLPQGREFVLEFEGKHRRIIKTPVHVRRSEHHEESGHYLSGLQLAPSCFEERKAIAEFVSRLFETQAA